MTRDEANLVINRVMDSADRVPNYEEDLKAIMEVFEDGSDENDTMVENVGMMACGSKKAFKSDFLYFYAAQSADLLLSTLPFLS